MINSLRRFGEAASGFEEALQHVDRNALARAEAVVYLASSCQCERRHAVCVCYETSQDSKDFLIKTKTKTLNLLLKAAASWATQAINELRPPRRLLAFATRVRGACRKILLLFFKKKM